MTTPAAAADGDAQETLDGVGEVLETLVNEEASGPTSAPTTTEHPAPTTSDISSPIDDAAEDNRVINAELARNEIANLSREGSDSPS